MRESSFSGRVDFHYSDNWSSYIRVFHDQGTSDQLEGVSGRNVHISDNPTNAVVSLQGILGSGAINEFKFGYNAAPTQIIGEAPVANGIDFGLLAINLSGSIANNGIQGQGASSGIVVPGGLVRANSATNGHASPYKPYSLTFADSYSRVAGSHLTKIGAEVRAIRMETDRIGGTTYSFSGIDSFLANTPSNVQYVGNLSDPSVFNAGATGPRHTVQNYYVGYAQDEFRPLQNLTLNYGLRYDYYTVLRERNDHIVKFNIDTGVIDPPTTPEYASNGSFQPRLSATYAVGPSTVLRTGFGIFVGPGQTEDQIQPVESDVIRTTVSNAQFPVDVNALRANFISNPDNRAYQPRAYANDYSIPERVYQYTASFQQELRGGMAATVAYVGSQGRNLFLRSVANNIIGLSQPDPTKSATVIREFSIVGADGSVQNPFAEIDYKTSGGHDSYNAMQLSLTRRSSNGLVMNAQYTLGQSKGNTGGSNEAQTNACNARTLDQFDCDNGFNLFDVRHTFNLSLLYNIPGEGVLKGGWSVGGIVNARSGLPIDVKIVRNDVVYVDGSGNVFTSAAAGRTAVINTPGGGSSRNVRRPDLIPGVDPFLHSGGLLFLNPAAFAVPAPGSFGNLERNSLHGPGVNQVDLVMAKRLNVSRGQNLEFRVEVFNLFNRANFSNPVGTLPDALPSGSVNDANKLQPGQPYSSAAAGSFGKITGTLGRTVGLGTSRQVQLAIRLNF